MEETAGEGGEEGGGGDMGGEGGVEDKWGLQPLDGKFWGTWDAAGGGRSISAATSNLLSTSRITESAL